VIRFLLKGAASVSEEVLEDLLVSTNKFGETPLNLALKVAANDPTIELLLNPCHEAVLVKEKLHGNLPIHTAAMFGNSAHTIESLLKIWPQAIHEHNRDGDSPMDLAVKHDKCSHEVVHLLAIFEYK
jgi:hypothetical protein